MDRSCKTCSHAIFCPTWGEYKCDVRMGWVCPKDKHECSDWKAKGKGKDERECHCPTCEERGY